MYRVIKGIPEQSPTWEVAELRKGKEELEAWHSLWCHRRGETEKGKFPPLPDQLSTSSGESETLEEKGSATGRTESHSHSGTESDDTDHNTGQLSNS
jgi:hypothetical protein